MMTGYVAVQCAHAVCVGGGGWLPHGDAAYAAYGEQGGCKLGICFRAGTGNGE
jgi:hypothetical protein